MSTNSSIGYYLNMKNKSLGFTLIEMMIAVAILGILAAIAYPQYVEYVAKGRRAECRSALLLAAQKMEKFYSNNNLYPSTLGAARIASNSNDGNPGASCTIDELTVLTSTPPAAGGTPATFSLTARTTYNDRYCTTLTLTETSLKDGSGPDKSRCWR
jgi:type IV pilus assembly protein PilE